MADAAFYGIATLTIGSAIVALESRELIYGAIALAISMLGIAGFFLLLDSPFVAMFQITVYVGAVAVLVLFTVMLVRTQALLMLIFMGGMGGIALFSGFNTLRSENAESPPVDFRLIGTEMLTYYSPALVVIGLTLAGSIISALTLARREDIGQRDERAS
jgi:NADH:ubiquinone oxidoreductase subunit 6 (subunit J)